MLTNGTFETDKKVLAEIMAVTKTIQEKHPELYVLLMETPLFLCLNKEENSEADFLCYLESIKMQLEIFVGGQQQQ